MRGAAGGRWLGGIGLLLRFLWSVLLSTTHPRQSIIHSVLSPHPESHTQTQTHSHTHNPLTPSHIHRQTTPPSHTYIAGVRVGIGGGPGPAALMAFLLNLLQHLFGAPQRLGLRAYIDLRSPPQRRACEGQDTDNGQPLTSSHRTWRPGEGIVLRRTYIVQRRGLARLPVKQRHTDHDAFAQSVDERGM